MLSADSRVSLDLAADASGASRAHLPNGLPRLSLYLSPSANKVVDPL